MIAFLEGELYEKRPEYVILKVGGVGYQTFIPLSTFYQLPEPPALVSLQVYTHVQTDTLQLYGFATQDEKHTFIKLLAIPRIGPKLALGILSGISPQDLARALDEGDLKRLAAIPGLGRKSAERLVVELKGKLKPATDHLASVRPPRLPLGRCPFRPHQPGLLPPHGRRRPPPGPHPRKTPHPGRHPPPQPGPPGGAVKIEPKVFNPVRKVV